MDNPYRPPAPSFSGDSSPGASAISRQIADVMRSTRPWPMIVGIISLLNTVFAGFNILRGNLSRSEPWFILILVVFLAVSVFLAIKLLSYSSKIGRLLSTGLARDLQKALAEHRHYWLTMGIIGLIILIIFVLALFAAIVRS
jgi:hypothetical protein